jgi:GNAT superfamily N-acetyltransferase
MIAHMPAGRAPRRPGRHHREDAEAAVLNEQLDALEEDIDAARAIAPQAVAGGLHLRTRHEPARPAPHGEAVRLPDGREILVRAVEPGDLPLLREAFGHLGAVSRFRRCLEPLDHLSDEEMRLLTDADHTRHEAVVAVDPATGEGIGTARYLRDEADPLIADVTVVVLDGWQHHGVGDTLMDRLTKAALAAGVTHCSGRMIVGNHAAERLLERVGDPVARVRGPGTVKLVVRLRGAG